MDTGTRLPPFPFRPGLDQRGGRPSPSGVPGGRIVAMFRQLEQSQWLAPRRLREVQFRRLRALVGLALRNIPAYRARLRAAGIEQASQLTARAWQSVPVLSKDELRTLAADLLNPKLNKRHEPRGSVRTSGSTGRPVTVHTTSVTRALWAACVLRDQHWHGHDLKLRLGSVRFFKRHQNTPGVERSTRSWGPPISAFCETGPGEMLSIHTPVSAQLEWLQRRRPDLLLTYPSNALELARQSLAQGLVFPFLREVRVFGETVSPEVRAACREAWGVPVVDAYTANEVGYIALQCPTGEHYHVQSENVLLELLDEHGRSCPPGRPGRVVLTTLHNYLMPLLRYEIGDYAEFGESCACGRGLPVLTRIMGRTRNMAVLPSGERYWPQVGSLTLSKVAPVVAQAQFVQRSPEEIEVRLVAERPLTEEEKALATERIHAQLHYPFRIVFTAVDTIERGPTGKFEEFKSLLPA